jgi:hypothetical protein
MGAISDADPPKGAARHPPCVGPPASPQFVIPRVKGSGRLLALPPALDPLRSPRPQGPFKVQAIGAGPIASHRLRSMRSPPRLRRGARVR